MSTHPGGNGLLFGCGFASFLDPMRHSLPVTSGTSALSSDCSDVTVSFEQQLFTATLI